MRRPARRAGAGGNIGAELVAKSAPNGYTILMGSIGTQALNASLYLRLRITADTDIDGAASGRSQLKAGMKLTAKYQVPEGFNSALGYDVTEMLVEQ